MIVATSRLTTEHRRALEKVARPTGGGSMTIHELETAVDALRLKLQEPGLDQSSRRVLTERLQIEEMRLQAKKNLDKDDRSPYWWRWLTGRIY